MRRVFVIGIGAGNPDYVASGQIIDLAARSDSLVTSEIAPTSIPTQIATAPTEIVLTYLL